MVFKETCCNENIINLKMIKQKTCYFNVAEGDFIAWKRSGGEKTHKK